MIAIIDYGRGNLGSVEKAFARLGVPATVTQDPRAVDDARAVVLPGDGAFHDAMANLTRLGLVPALRRALDGSRPFLGICLGYQLRRFAAGRKVPHMGWNGVEHGGRLRLFEGVPEGARFYFVHSYYPEGRTGDCATSAEGPLKQAWCEYGVRFAAAVELGRIHATQFHPEKSQRWGLRLLENFAAIVKESA